MLILQNMGTNAVFIGAGNLATSVAIGFQNSGISVVQVVSRTIDSSMQLASKVSASALCKLNKITLDADLYVVAVPDSQIKTVLDTLKPLNGLIVHTSGSTPIGIFDEKKFPNHGVLYPFQTFTKSKIVELSNVTFCIEANSSVNTQKLFNIANQVKCKAVNMNSEQRRWLHLTGVFGCNFVNLMLTMAHQIALPQNIDFEIIKPLVETTIQKAFSGNPQKMQTGPAIRNDRNTMTQHMEMLKNQYPELQKIYNELSLEIQRIGGIL